MDSPQQVCENYPAFLNMVFAMAMSSDPSQIPVALDTLGVLGGTVEGKQVLHKTGVRMVSDYTAKKVHFLVKFVSSLLYSCCEHSLFLR